MATPCGWYRTAIFECLSSGKYMSGIIAFRGWQSQDVDVVLSELALGYFTSEDVSLVIDDRECLV